MPLTSKGKKIMASMKKRYGKKKGEEVFYASKNKGTIEGVEETKENKPMNHLDKFINQILLGEQNQTDPTRAQIEAANRDVYTMGNDKPKPHPKSPAGLLAKAAEKRLRLPPAVKAEDPEAAIAQHKKDIRRAGEEAVKSNNRKRASLETSWTVYKQMGSVLAEALGLVSEGESTGADPKKTGERVGAAIAGGNLRDRGEGGTEQAIARIAGKVGRKGEEPFPKGAEEKAKKRHAFRKAVDRAAGGGTIPKVSKKDLKTVGAQMPPRDR